LAQSSVFTLIVITLCHWWAWWQVFFSFFVGCLKSTSANDSNSAVVAYRTIAVNDFRRFSVRWKQYRHLTNRFKTSARLLCCLNCFDCEEQT